MRFILALLALAAACAVIVFLGQRPARADDRFAMMSARDVATAARCPPPKQCRPVRKPHAGEAAMHGIASVYAVPGKDRYAWRRTANGERANPGALTAAHRTLPFGTRVLVTNRHNGKSAVVRINDRGPFVRGRVIDLTPAGARAIGKSGLAPVNLERVN
jgi:rare lipoprotein A